MEYLQARNFKKDAIARAVMEKIDLFSSAGKA
jgi:hypothetical protein